MGVRSNAYERNTSSSFWVFLMSNESRRGLRGGSVAKPWQDRVVIQADGCWRWSGAKNSGGYGHLNVSGKHWFAHRLSYTEHVGPIPRGLNVLHRCDVRDCVNPDHLFLGTQGDNVQDMMSKGRGRSRPNSMPGERSPQAKLTWGQVAEIRRLAKSGVTYREIALMFKSSRSNISGIVSGKNWKTGETLVDELKRQLSDPLELGMSAWFIG